MQPIDVKIDVIFFSGHHVLAASTQPDLEDWMARIKQAVQEDRLRRRRTKGQSMVVASPEDNSIEYNDSGMSYKNRVDSGERGDYYKTSLTGCTSQRRIQWNLDSLHNTCICMRT